MVPKSQLIHKMHVFAIISNSGDLLPRWLGAILLFTSEMRQLFQNNHLKSVQF